jgi:hypothetical protein
VRTLQRVIATLLEHLGMTTRHLTQAELARRWGISPRSLEKWRWLGRGPRFLKIGSRCAYRVEDVEAYEAERLRVSTAKPDCTPKG